MESKEELLQKLNNLPEEEKKKIENMKNLKGEELEKAVGGLNRETKVLLGCLSVTGLIALFGAGAAGYAIGYDYAKNRFAKTSNTTNAKPDSATAAPTNSSKATPNVSTTHANNLDDTPKNRNPLEEID